MDQLRAAARKVSGINRRTPASAQKAAQKLASWLKIEARGRKIPELAGLVAKALGLELAGLEPAFELLDALRPDLPRRSPKSAKRARERDASAIPFDDPLIKDFYQSLEWKRLSYEVKRERGRRCECCGATPEHGVRIVTDHVKPIRKHWHLRFERSNLQVLCDDCNVGKGSHDETDWRESSSAEPAEVSPMILAQLTPPDGFLN